MTRNYLSQAVPSPVGSGARLDPYEQLAETDEVLRGIVERRGRPDPFVWAGAEPSGSTNFAAMVLHITSQQISTAVALTVFGRIAEAIGGLPDAQSIVLLSPQRLRGFGLSGAKSSYLIDLARRQLDGTLDVDHLDHLDDEQVITALTAVKGVGRWTAEMFLIHQLCRPDVLPAGDLGIRRAVQLGWSLEEMPDINSVLEFGSRWAPYRTYASSLLWLSLSERRSTGTRSTTRGR